MLKHVSIKTQSSIISLLVLILTTNVYSFTAEFIFHHLLFKQLLLNTALLLAF